MNIMHLKYYRMVPTKNIFCPVSSLLPHLWKSLHSKCLVSVVHLLLMPISATNLLLEERTVKDENSFVFLNLPINQNLRDIQILIIVTEFYRYQNLPFTWISSPPFAMFHVVYCHFRSERIIGTREDKSLRNNRD